MKKKKINIFKLLKKAKELPESNVKCINFDITKKRRTNEKSNNYIRSFGTY
jgi:putative N-acetylmannosamine-6-phosphate epimerase